MHERPSPEGILDSDGHRQGSGAKKNVQCALFLMHIGDRGTGSSRPWFLCLPWPSFPNYCHSTGPWRRYIRATGSLGQAEEGRLSWGVWDSVELQPNELSAE